MRNPFEFVSARIGHLSRKQAYAIAVIMVIAGSLARWWLPDLFRSTPFLTFYPAVVVSAALGGYGPGMLATLAFCVAYLLFPFGEPIVSLGIAGLVRVSVFVGSGFLVSIVSELKIRLTARQLEQSRELEKLTLMTDLGPFMIRDAQDRITHWSEGCSKLYGFTKDQALGRISHDLLRTVFPEPLENIRQKLLTSGRWEGELTHVRSDNTTLIVSSNWVLRNDTSQIAILEIDSDITYLKQIERSLNQSEQRIRATFENAGVGIVEVEAEEDRFIAVNNRSCQILKRSREQLLTMDVHELTWPEDRPLTDRMNAEMHSGVRDRIEYEKRYIRGDGSPVWVHINASAVKDVQGRWIRSVTTFEDISERKKVEGDLRDSEVFYRQTLESIPGMVFTTRADGYCDFQSRQWVEYTGVPMSEHLGDGWNKLLHPDDRARASSAWQSAVGERAPYDLEYRVRRRDGIYEWFKVIGRPIRDAGGNIVRWFGVAINIEDLKRAGEVLRKSEDRFRGIVEASAAAVWTADPDGAIVEDSPSWRAFTGQTLEQFLGKGWVDAVHPDDRAQASCAWMTAVERDAVYCTEYRLWHASSGGYRKTLARGVRIANGDGSTREWVGMNIDVTELREAETARRESEELLLLALAAAQLGIWHYEPATGKISYDERTRAILGGVEPEFYSQVIEEIIHGEDVLQFDAAVQHVLTPESEGTLSAEFRVLWPDKSVHWVQADGKTVFSGEGPDRRALRIVGTAKDVTDRKTAETALCEAVDRYERQVRLFEGVASTTPDFVYIFDRQGRFMYANSRLLEVWGMKLLDVVGRTCRELGYEQWHHDMHMREIVQVIETKRPIKGEVPFTAPRTGIFGIYEYIFTPVIGRDGEVELIAGTTRDVTERKRSEEALEDARRSAEQANRAKDHFLAVLSHELRTPLTPVVMGISMLQEKPALDAQTRETLERIRQNVEMEVRLIDDLLDVTRIARGKVELNRRKVELCEVVERAVAVCRPDIEARKLHFGVDMGSGAPYWVDVDPSRLQQVFWNLLNNAIKFTGHGGYVGIRCRPNETHVSIEVNDSGIGIEPEALSRVFDAFEQAERSITRHFGGLGLGLAISKAIVEMHGGEIKAFSGGKNRGASFQVTLPLSMPQSAPMFLSCPL